MTPVVSNLMSLEAQKAIKILRRDVRVLPIVQSDNGGTFILLDFKIMLNNSDLTRARMRTHAPEQNEMVERAD